MLQYLAIDIGGSKTIFTVTDEYLNEKKTVTAPGFGISYETDEDLPEFRSIAACLAKEYEICSVAVNLGGKNKNQIYNILKDCFPNSIISVFRESQGLASIALAKHYNAEAVLLAGTGTIITAFDDKGKTIISGGWGMNIGDGGSGYYIGLEAVKHSLKALDKSGTLTPMVMEITGLEQPVLPSYNADEICEIRDKVRSGIFPIERAKIARISHVVTKYCEKGEEDALEIMKMAGLEMAELCSDCVNKLLPYTVKKVVVSGGLVKCNSFWRDAFEKKVMLLSGINRFEYVSDGVLEGTKLIAVNQYKGEE